MMAVGFLTIMTIAVTERTAEIGLLRAIGARRVPVLGVFLIEAIVLGFAGGLLGSTLAVALVEFIGAVLPAMPIRTAGGYVAGALVLALAIGLVTGIFPALRAARLQPLEALCAEQHSRNAQPVANRHVTVNRTMMALSATMINRH
jgi:putative ABC transport system permease protein